MPSRRILPKVRDRISFLYVDHCRVEQEGRAILVLRADYRAAIPCANLASLLLGPGVAITSAAIKAIAAAGCSVSWVGNDGFRFYAAGSAPASCDRLIHQATVWADPAKHLTIAKAMYRFRFGQPSASDATIQQLRGMEGRRMRQIYQEWSQRTGVQWAGRSYRAGAMEDSDPINQALSIANTCLYAVVQSAIAAVGYSAGLGFVHHGNAFSFVYDVADLYKASTTIPAAFEVVAAGYEDLGAAVRKALREKLCDLKLMHRITDNVDDLLGYQASEPSDGTVLLWDDQEAWVQGGINWEGKA